MALTHGDFTFSHIAGVIRPTNSNQPIQTITFPGIRGVTHVVDSIKERQLTVEYTMLEFSTEAQRQTAIDAIEEHKGNDGTLDDGSVSYEKCTFLGFAPSQLGYSPGGSEGYFVIGQLNFIQRRIN